MKKSVLITLFMFLSLSFLIFIGCKDPEVPHSHTFADSWTSDATHHWKAATCEHTEEVSEKAGHTFGEYVSNNDATTEVDGTKTRECGVCGYEDTVTDEGSKIHVHSYSTDWTYNGAYHWKAATCEHTGEVREVSGHSFGDWTTTKEPTEEAKGSKKRVCSVCKYEETAEIAKLAHTHKFATDWTYNGTNHWKAATCEHTEEVSEKAGHTFGEYVSNNDATTEEDGTKTRECGVCGYKETVIDEGSKIIVIYSVELETTTIGETYTGTIPVRITGVNLLAYDITSQDSNISNINYVSNTEATAELNIDNSVGSHLVTINCGTASGCATYNVIEVEKCFAVGDILFTDGTKMKVEDVQYGVPDEQISKAFGVIASTTYGGGVGKAVGLQKGTNLQWAPYGTAGFEKNFTKIQGTTVSGDLDGSDNWGYICSVFSSASQNAATKYPAFNFANTYGATAGLTGTDYADGWYVPTIAELYDIYTNGLMVKESLFVVGGAETIIGMSNYWSSSQYASDNYYAYLLSFYDGTVYKYYKDYNCYVLVLQSFNCEQFNNYEIVHDGTNITSVKIATAGEGYKGDLLVTIEGTNLKGHDITCDDESFSNLTYISNTFATATITCDGNVGTSEITITCESSSVTGTVKVLSSTNCFTNNDIGKIILSDGSFVTKDNFNSSTMTPIAVVVGVKNNGGQVVGVGLQRGTYFQWAPIKTTGYRTKFTEIQSNYTSSSSSGYTFTGDMDGSDNWTVICKVDPEGTVYPATNYPAFNFANTYGITADLTGTDYKNSWYLPSIAELYDIYYNKSTIQESLTATGGCDISSGVFVSSSQDSYSISSAYVLNFLDGNVSIGDKDSYGSVLVLQAFNAQ